MLIAASCSNDFTEQVNQGAEIGFNASVGGPTRATEVVLSTLGDFKVHAHSVSHNGDIYETPLIDNMTAKKSQTVENLWALDGAQVYWPSDVPSIKTWAYYPADLTGVTMNYANQNIANYSPKKSADAANKNDGAVQQDVLVAYTNAERSNGTSIDVTFKHALCHVGVYAKKGTSGNKNVFIKGAWIVNVKSSNTLAFDTDKSVWSWNTFADDATKTVYGYEFPDGAELHSADRPLLSVNNANSSLMLLPQKLDKWDLASTDKEVNAAKGAYIVLLCRVEAVHEGTIHDGGTDDGIKIEDGKHIHQMFPYTKNFDENEYGYTCVPIDTEWKMGKKYIYTLEFCGAHSGAGIYPPTADIVASLPSSNGEFKYIQTLPDGKKIGDAVLDNPISFKVKVDVWGTDDEWTEGNVGMQ